MRNLDDWLEAVHVHEMPYDTEEAQQPATKYLEGWSAVSTADDGGIIAYFRDEADAFRFRLDYINGKMNPVQPIKPNE